MFFYFYDNIAKEKKYEATLIGAENRLIELGINGRIEKSSVLKNVKETIDIGIKNGAHTIIAVGNDNTLLKVINIVANYNDLVIGYIPLELNSKFCHLFGITDTLEACNILSKRLIKKINLGKANQNYFLSSAAFISSELTTLECEDKYNIFLQSDYQVYIYNLGNFLEENQINNWEIFSAKNNLHLKILEPKNKSFFNKFFLNNKSPNHTFIPINKIKISTKDKSLAVLLDQQIVIKSPLTITCKPKKINLIVGRDRKI